MTKAFFQLAVIALTVLLGALIPAHAAGDDALVLRASSAWVCLRSLYQR